MNPYISATKNKKGVVFTIDTVFAILYIGILLTTFAYISRYPVLPLKHNHYQMMTCSLLKALYESGRLHMLNRKLIEGITQEQAYFSSNVKNIIKDSLSDNSCYSIEIFMFKGRDFSPYKTAVHDEGCMRRNIVTCDISMYTSPDYFSKIVLKVGEKID